MSNSFSNLWPFLATTAFIAMLGIATWRQPNRPGRRYFGLLVSTWMIWAAATTLELSAWSDEVRFTSAQLQIFCALLGSSFELFFVLEYTGQRKWLTPRFIAMCILPAFLFESLALTNTYHHLIWANFSYGAEVIQVRGPLAWIGIIYSYLLWFINISMLAGSLLRSHAFSKPILLMLFGQAFPRIAFLIARPELTNFSPLQLSILASNLTALAYFVALFNYRLLRVTPVASDAVLERMAFGLIVLDAEDHVVELNPAAKALLGLPLSITLGQTASQTLGAWWGHILPLIADEAVSQELVLGEGIEQRVFEVNSLPLIHPSGWRFGRVVVLNDTTPAWRARKMVAQQQWAQAILQEREQLAQELHDGLSQNLGFLNLQAQAAQVYLQTGQEGPVQSCLDRLVEVSLKMQDETRELISNLMIVGLPAEGFVPTLRQTLTNFEKHTGLRTILEIDKEAQSLCNPDILEPAVIVQLLRITQEALANVRKHAQHPSRVVVRLVSEKCQLRLIILDDGAGFDLASIQPGDGKHFGLQIMRQRAARIGAQFSIFSNIGQGTRVELYLPVSGARNEV